MSSPMSFRLYDTLSLKAEVALKNKPQIYKDDPFYQKTTSSLSLSLPLPFGTPVHLPSFQQCLGWECWFGRKPTARHSANHTTSNLVDLTSSSLSDPRSKVVTTRVVGWNW